MPRGNGSQLYMSLSKIIPPCVIFHQVRVQRVTVDGLTRTKDDIIIKEVKPLLQAKTFDEVIIRYFKKKIAISFLWNGVELFGHSTFYKRLMTQ